MIAWVTFNHVTVDWEQHMHMFTGAESYAGNLVEVAWGAGRGSRNWEDW